jgi:hypothetical protein
MVSCMQDSLQWLQLTCVRQHRSVIIHYCCGPGPHAVEVVLRVWQQGRGQPGPVGQVLAHHMAPEGRSCSQS